MKEKINVFDHAGMIDELLKKGIFLNTYDDKFNSMVIGWGHLGVIWGMETFTVYVRKSRYTKGQIDKTRQFTVSVPMSDADPEIFRVCGFMSGRDVDKAAYVTLEEPNVNHVPGIREFPLTIECEVIYAQDQLPELMDEEILRRYYSDPEDEDDHHTMYIGKIVDAYIIKD